MRLLGLALSAALLSGCSYLGGIGGASGGGHDAPGPRYGAQPTGFADPCQIPHRAAPVPQGCHPSQVSIGLPVNPAFGGAPYASGQNMAGGFAQTPQFGAPQYADAGYGSHADQYNHAPALRGPKGPKVRKPRFRGALDLGVEKSVSGSLLDYSRSAPNDPVSGYNPYLYGTTSQSGTDGPNGTRITSRYYADTRDVSGARRNADGSVIMIADPNDPNAMIPDPAFASFDALAPYDVVEAPTLSFDDAWSTPATVGLSGEYILGPRASLFGRVGYSVSEGKSGDAATLTGTVYRDTTIETFDANGDPILPATTTTVVREGEQLAAFAYDFSDMRRLDLEAGGRLYMNPIAGRDTGRTVTPFFGASAGASRYNAVSYRVAQQQADYRNIFVGGPDSYTVTTNPALGDTSSRQLYDAQWVPTGRLAVGAEWQVAPRTALALETGIKVDGKRDYSNGAKGSSNVSVPVTLRGSFNF